MKIKNAIKLVGLLAEYAITIPLHKKIYVMKSGIYTDKKPSREHDCFSIPAILALDLQRHDDIALQLVRFFKQFTTAPHKHPKNQPSQPRRAPQP